MESLLTEDLEHPQHLSAVIPGVVSNLLGIIALIVDCLCVIEKGWLHHRIVIYKCPYMNTILLLAVVQF